MQKQNNTNLIKKKIKEKKITPIIKKKIKKKPF